MSEWQPIETIPSDGRTVLLWFASEFPAPEIDRGGWSPVLGRVWWSGDDIISQPTHWMPLPAPPVTP